jgi:hypothetical protein
MLLCGSEPGYTYIEVSEQVGAAFAGAAESRKVEEPLCDGECKGSRAINYWEDILSAEPMLGGGVVEFENVGRERKDVQFMIFRWLGKRNAATGVYPGQLAKKQQARVSHRQHIHTAKSYIYIRDEFSDSRSLNKLDLRCLNESVEPKRQAV